jgi:hypothetical protein
VRIAFKEWMIVVDALGRGEQCIILRKGGISEGPGGFKVEHSPFLLFPTLFHQQRESVVRSAQSRFEEIAPSLPAKDRVRIEWFCEVAAGQRLDSLAAAEQLRGQHIWRDEVIAERFDWGREKNIHALAVRVFHLPKAVELPMLENYGGCKSWIALEQDLSLDGAMPVLSDTGFAQKLTEFREALEMTRVSPKRVRAKTSAGQEAYFEQNDPHPDPLPSDGRGNSQTRCAPLPKRLDRRPADGERYSLSHPMGEGQAFAAPKRLRPRRRGEGECASKSK